MRDMDAMDAMDAMDHTVRDRLNRLLGYDFYSGKSQLRADDLLVRSQASQFLSAAADRLRDLAAEWRHRHVPPSTREHPFPPPEALAPMEEAGRRRRELEDASARIRGLSVPNQDWVWERLRQETDTLDLLLQFDWLLVTQSESVSKRVAVLSADQLDQVDWSAVDAALRAVLATAEDRQRHLAKA